MVTGTFRRVGSRNLIVGVGEVIGNPLHRYVINDPELELDDGAEVTQPNETHLIIAGVSYLIGDHEERQGVILLTAD
jgi:hypothetical protein